MSKAEVEYKLIVMEQDYCSGIYSINELPRDGQEHVYSPSYGEVCELKEWIEKGYTIKSMTQDKYTFLLKYIPINMEKLYHE